MEFSELKKNSLAVSFMSGISARLNRARYLFLRLIRESRMRRIASSLGNILDVAAKNSFFGRFAKARYDLDPVFLLEASRCAGKLSGPAIKIKGVFSRYLRESRIFQYRNRGDCAGFFSFRNAGIVVVFAVAVNLILSFIFKQKIGATGYIFRSVLLFLGLAVWFGEKQ